MTSIVALRCKDGVVIGSDSAVTLSTLEGNVFTIEQHTSQKLRIVGHNLILAGTGSLGLMQRFHAVLENAHAAGRLAEPQSGIEFGKLLADLGLQDFHSTHLTKFDFSAYVGFVVGGEPYLCELDGATGFQPELKEPTDIWYVSGGHGQGITDPFLALLAEAFWAETMPSLRGGIFTVLWALQHVCKLNAGGIGYPIHIAVLDQATGEARHLTQEELAEHEDIVQGAMSYLGSFRDILEGRIEVESVPTANDVG